MATKIIKIFFPVILFYDDDDDDDDDDNNNNNNLSETRKYWVIVQRGIVSSHGERDLLYP